jgi:hypothetical protein
MTKLEHVTDNLSAAGIFPTIEALPKVYRTSQPFQPSEPLLHEQYVKRNNLEA